MSRRSSPPLTAAVAALAIALAAAGCGAGHATTRASAPASAPSTAVSDATAASAPTADWPEFGYDPQRSDAGPANTGITAGDLGRLGIRRVTLPGLADSSAIELGGVKVRGRRRDVAIVTTSYGITVAVDVRTGAVLWRFYAPGVNRSPGNPQVTTASPVADPDRRSVYAPAPNGYVYKLSVAAGRVQWSRRITLDPGHEKIASALNVSGPWVVAVTGGYIGDIPPYDGHVVTLARADGRIGHVWNSECSNRHRLIRATSCSVTNTRGDNALWGRAGAVIEGGRGRNDRIVTATGNGPFNGSDNWGDSVLELTPDASRLLHNWTPTDQAKLSRSDQDVGSTSPALLGRWHGRSLAAQGGKAGVLDLLDLDRLDGTTDTAGPRLGGQLSQISSPGGGQMMTAPAVWHHAGGPYLFAATDSGTAAYRLADPAHPQLQTVWQDGDPSTSPVIAGGLLYAYDEQHGTLNVRAPLTGRLLRAFPVGDGHWNSPIVVGGAVILPIGSYHDAAATGTLVILHLPGH